MLPGGTDGLYRAALAAPHRMTSRIEVYDSLGLEAQLLHADLPFLSGMVTATLSSRVTRQLNFAVDESFYPVDPQDMLAPYGSAVRVYRGVELGDGSTAYEWQVFGGRIQRTTLDSSGRVTVSCADPSSDVVAFGFETPRNSDTGVLVPTQIQTLISDALPSATFGTSDTYTETVQPLTWENNRGGALDELAFAVGSFWYALADESFVTRRYPWTVPATPVTTIADGDGGIITGYQVSRSREGVFNSVTVTGERLNGAAPQHYTARDMTTGSPTEYSSNFGVRTKHMYLQTPGNASSAQTAALDALRRDIALIEFWQWSQVPDPALELGDVVAINAAGRTGVVQVVDSFTMPLDVSSPMSVTGRSLIVPVLGLSSMQG